MLRSPSEKASASASDKMSSEREQDSDMQKQNELDVIANREAAYKARIEKLSADVSRLMNELQIERTKSRVGSPTHLNNKPTFAMDLLFDPSSRARLAEPLSPAMNAPISPTDLSLEMHERNDGVASKRQDNADLDKKIKLYKFWTYDPEAWFALVESQFAYHRVESEQQKFFSVMKHLGDDVISQIVHELKTIDFFATDKYQKLKLILLNKFAETDEMKLQKLFGGCKLNGRKPSVYFAELVSLALGQVSRKVIIQIWLSGLPYEIKILVIGKLDSNNEKAILDYADLIFEQIQNKQHQMVNAIESLEASEPQINAVNKYQSKFVNPNNSNNSNPSRNSNNKSLRPNRKYFCYFHAKFKEKANKCIHP